MKDSTRNAMRCIDLWKKMDSVLFDYRELTPHGWAKAFHLDDKVNCVTIDSFVKCYEVFGKRYIVSAAIEDRDYFLLLDIAEKTFAEEDFDFHRFIAKFLKHIDPGKNKLFTLKEIKGLRNYLAKT